MRPKNRKIKKNASFKTGSMGVASLILSGFVVLMAYWMFDSKCASIQREIGKAEQTLAALDSECERERVRWNEMTTPEKVSEHLTRFGLEMKRVHQNQVVRMSRDGRPHPNQVAVTRAKARMNAMANMASYKAPNAVPVPVRATTGKSRTVASTATKGRTTAGR